MPRFNVTAPDGSIIPVDAPAGATEQDAIAFAAATFKPAAAPAAAPAQSEIPAPRQRPGFLTQLGRGAASLADVTVGGVIPAVAQQVGYGLARLSRSPQEAQAATARVVGAVEQPFGKAFGVTGTPEYQQEAGRQVLDFIGQNFQKGAKWIAGKTGLPQSDVENYLGTAGLAAPKVAPAVARTVQQATAPAIEKAVIGAKMPFEGRRQAKLERQSLEDYARGPQLDAIAEAKRLNILLDPTEIKSTVGTRLTTMAAGEKGVEAITSANKNQVRNITLNELNLPPTTQLSRGIGFKQARENVAGPYDEVAKLPIQQADDAMVQRLEAIRADLDVIGAKEYAPAISKIVDDAIAKTETGLTGGQLLKNISVLRERAKRTYNNKSATSEALDVADTNLKIATELESLIDNSISNPKLLEQFRNAREKMARTYVYEGATDFNTGILNVDKLARITAKNNNLTGDIAALGQIAGNFPEVFTSKAATPMSKALSVGRSGAAGTLGGVAGYALGQDYISAAAGTLLGALGGKVGQTVAANRMASPSYQAGLSPRDMRIPVNQLAASMQPQTAAVTASAAELGQQLNSAQIKIAQLEGELRRAGDAAERQFITEQINRLQQFAGQIEQNLQNAASPQNFNVVSPTVPAPAQAPNVPANRMLGYDPNVPSTAEVQMNRLRKEDVLDYQFRQQAEQRAEAAEAAARQPSRGGVELMVDNAGNLVPVPTAGAGGVMPSALESAVAKMSGQMVFEPRTQYETVQTGSYLNRAPMTETRALEQLTLTPAEAKKYALPTRQSQAFAMTAEEKIAWNKAKADIAEVAPGFKALSDKAVAEKMMDRQWLQDAIIKAQQKAKLQDQIIARANNERARQAAMVEREKLTDALETLEEQFRKARPVQRGGQGPKTRAFQRNMLTPEQEIQNALSR